MAGVEKIFNGKQFLGFIIRKDYHDSGIQFLTSDDSPQQLGYMNRAKDYVIAPHVHNTVPRTVELTQEVLIIQRGKVRVDYYDDQDAQWICDAEDSAVYMTGWGVTPFIGDHTNQGFSGIRSCVDDTKAFIRHDGNTYVYDCTYVGGGTNDGYNIYDWNGEMIWNHGSNDLGMYTCNGNWQNVSIVLFSLIDVL